MHHGREVFDNGVTRLWRCPVCSWWRGWSEERCCGCGLARDNPDADAIRHRTAGSAA